MRTPGKLSAMIDAAPKGAMLACTKANKGMVQELCRMMGREDLKVQVADEGGFGGGDLKNAEVDSIPVTLLNQGTGKSPVWEPIAFGDLKDALVQQKREPIKSPENPFHRVVFYPLPTEKTEEP